MKKVTILKKVVECFMCHFLGQCNLWESAITSKPGLDGYKHNLFPLSNAL